MKQRRFIKAFAAIIFSAFLSLHLHAQIFLPDGLRMPGDWNGWTNNTGMGGDFDLQRTSLGTLRWQTTFQYNGQTGNQQFKFVSTSHGDAWGNQWAGNSSVAVKSLVQFTYGTPSNPNNQVSLVQNRWYTVVFEDKGYQNSRAIFMETSSAPVEIASVQQNPYQAVSSGPVQITAGLSAPPSAEERLFLRYTTNNWSSSTAVAMTVNSNQAQAEIPAFPAGSFIEYYVFSSVLSNPAPDFDLVTLKMNNNQGDNYAYLVDQAVDCNIHTLFTNPAFPLESAQLTLTLNTASGNLALLDYAGDIYMHSGVITNLSANNSDWRYVKTSWGENTVETRLTRMSGEDNLYTLQINDIRSYYNVPSGEDILQLAMVFRSDGSTPPNPDYLVHKNADGSDFFLKIYEESLNVKITNPEAKTQMAGSNRLVSVCAETLENTSLAIYLNDALVVQENTESLQTLVSLHSLSPGIHWIKAVASGNSKSQARDSVAVYIRGSITEAPLPQGAISGINYIDSETLTLVLHDPPAFKKHVFVIGDFNNWTVSEDGYMNRTPDGMYYWKTITGLTPGMEYAYQYLIDGELRLADPYTHKVLDPWNDHWISNFNYPDLKPWPEGKTTGIVSVLQTDQPGYAWQVTDFVRPDVRDLVIYELHIRDFTETDAIKTVMEKLDYLQDLGVNAIELMPVNEFEGNDSWGYNPSFYFATDKAYGTRNDYKRFIDECHKRGIAVILDVVLNHSFSQSPLVQMYFDPDAGDYGQVTPENPWYNVESPNPAWSWGFDFDHESPYTQDFVDRFNTFWLTEFKVDGFRFDFTKGFTNTPDEGWNYDAARIAILKRMADVIWDASPGAYVILEHLTDNNEEVELANYGMLIWGNMEPQYAEATMGYQDNSDLSWGLHTVRGYAFHNLISYMESHDEERLMFKNLQYGNSYNPNHDVKNPEVALARNELAAVFYFTAPGPKMIWQFGELGYDYGINHCPDGSYNPDCRTSRKPIRWDYFDEPARRKLYDVYAAMIQLKTGHPVFRTGNIVHSLDTYLKRIHLNENPDGSGMKVTLLGNFDVVERSITPYFQETGTWYEFFTGNEMFVSNTTDPITLQPGEYRLYSRDKFYQVYYSKPTGDLSNPANWGTNTDGSGAPPTDFSQNYSHYNVVNGSEQSIDNNWTVSGNHSRLFIGNSSNAVNLTLNASLETDILHITDFSSLTIAPGAQLTVNERIINHAGLSGLILQTDEDATASLLHFNTGIRATAERLMSGEPYEWHMVSSPVGSQSIEDGFDDGNVYTWHEPAQTWVGFQNTTLWPTWEDANPGNSFLAAKGYLAAYPHISSLAQSKSFTGALNEGPHHFSITRLAHPDDTYVGYNLAGNPYPSALDWKANEGWERSALQQTGEGESAGWSFWIWNPDAQQYGTYHSAQISNEGTLGTSRHIAPMQGFWVKAAENGTMGMDNRVRTHSGQNWLKDHHSSPGVLRLALSSHAMPYRDEVILEFGHAHSGGGSGKMFSMHQEAPGLFLKNQEQKSSIGFYREPDGQEPISLGLIVGRGGEYSLAVSGLENFEENLSLEDLQTGIIQLLSHNPVYHFAANISDNPDRFLLHFNALGTEFSSNSPQARVTYNRQQLIVFAPWEGNTSLVIYDANGRSIGEYNLRGVQHHIIGFRQAPGLYIAALLNERQSKNFKIIVPD